MPLLNFVGFDPGGKAAFGWAVLSSLIGQVELVASGTCSNAPDAVDAARRACSSKPKAFAVDAPLFWIQSGDRKADEVVRKMVCHAGGQSGTVSHVNSLRGACLVQGILVAQMAAEAWPDAQISETHPKALLRISAETKGFSDHLDFPSDRQHERDAAIAAFSALKLFVAASGWHDLAKSEQNPFFPAGKPVAYWFPQTQT